MRSVYVCNVSPHTPASTVRALGMPTINWGPNPLESPGPALNGVPVGRPQDSAGYAYPGPATNGSVRPLGLPSWNWEKR